MAQICPPKRMVDQMAEQTRRTGREHGFVQCGDGTVTTLVGGEEHGIDLLGLVEQCDSSQGAASVYHTHPGGVAELSSADLDQLYTRGDIGTVCATAPNPGQNVGEEAQKMRVQAGFPPYATIAAVGIGLIVLAAVARPRSEWSGNI